MATTKQPVRYAVIGLGHIAQVAVLPGFAHARRNSTLAAVVSGDAAKRRAITRQHGVDAFDYDQYEECLRQVDAVYIALPNSMHADYAVRAARAGVHVLCEKPLAVTVPECRRIITACRNAGVKLMVAYRLHFEAVNLHAIDVARTGGLGTLKYFTSSFSMRVRRGDIRTQQALGGGTLHDIGIYCINAARNLFRAEPTRVSAITGHSGLVSLEEVDETTAATLHFSDGRLATFVTSFNAADVAAFRIVGTRGHLHVDPAYEYSEGLAYTLTVDDKTTKKTQSRTDQFGPQLLYFSDCILQDRIPEPSGEEGLQDVRIIQALYRSAKTGRTVSIPPFTDRKRPSGRQRISKPAVRKPRLVKVQSASR